MSDAIGHDRLARLMKRGADFLGCEVAVLGGAMSWISERHLVSALSNAGAFGVIACGAMTPDLLDTEIAETKKRTQKPFGVNLITMHPMLSELIDVCAQHRVSHVVLAGGLPPSGSIDRIKGNGAKLICFAPAFALAKKLITPPFKPKLLNETDTQNFDPEFTNALNGGGPASLNARAAALAAGVTTSTPLSPGMQANFKGFTFVDENRT